MVKVAMPSSLGGAGPQWGEADWRAYGLLLFMGTAWGLSLSTMKLAGAAGGHPVGMALWMVTVSGSMLLLASLVVFRPSWPRLAVLRFCAICGACGVAFPGTVLFWSAQHLPAGVVALAFAVMPLLTYGLSVVFRVEAGQAARLFGVVIGLAAMLLVILPKGALPDPGAALWVCITLVASLSMAFENFYAGGFRPPDANSLQLSCGRQLGAVFLLAPIVTFTGTAVPLFTSWGSLQWMTSLSGVLSGLAYTAMLTVIRTAGPVFASQAAYLITLTGVAWGMLIFDERHSLFVWVALAMTLLAIAMVRPRRPRNIARLL